MIHDDEQQNEYIPVKYSITAVAYTALVRETRLALIGNFFSFLLILDTGNIRPALDDCDVLI